MAIPLLHMTTDDVRIERRFFEIWGLPREGCCQMNLRIELTKTPKPKPADESKLGFGAFFTDHMMLMNYTEDKGWHDPRIVPFGPIPMSPASSCLHYAQEVFEGLKAYRDEDGNVRLFRPDENFRRLNNSNRRLCIPEIDEAFALSSLMELLRIEKDWVPKMKDASLYIRPFIMAVDEKLGVHPAHNYIYCVILSPSGAYYATGLNPISIYVENEYVRAVRGGIGFAKTAGNYAASLKAQEKSEAEGYAQVLWLDGVEQKYIEEVGSMNVFFVIGDEVVTPALSGSILPGITRMSAMELLRSWGVKVSERRIDVNELVEANQKGLLKEIFGTGTAAVISPVGKLKYGDTVMTINDNKIGALSQKLYNSLTDIQWGRANGPEGWSVVVG